MRSPLLSTFALFGLSMTAVALGHIGCGGQVVGDVAGSGGSGSGTATSGNLGSSAASSATRTSFGTSSRSTSTPTVGFSSFTTGASSGSTVTSCMPSSCIEVGASCGVLTDPRCGGLLECGACEPGTTCGGGGVPNQCGTTGFTTSSGTGVGSSSSTFMSSGSSAFTSTSTSSGTGTGSATACAPFGNLACDACLAASCCPTQAACLAVGTCAVMFKCFQECLEQNPSGGLTCAQSCLSQYSTPEGQAFESCGERACVSSCQ